MISVIITVFNKEQQIESCISSVLEQNYSQNFEIIIINDGSTDDSNKIIEKCIKDKNIIYINQSNKGVSAARNTGIRTANGDYILFLDGDDELKHDCLTKLSSKISIKPDLIVGNFTYKTRNLEYNNRDIKNNDYLKNELEEIQTKFDMFIGNGNPLVSVCNKLYKKNLLIKNNIMFQEGVIAEDRLFNLMLFTVVGTISTINEFTYIINVSEDSRSRNKKITSIEQHLNLNRIFVKYLEDANIKNNIDLVYLNLLKDTEKILSEVYQNSKNIKVDLRERTNYILKDKLFNKYFAIGYKNKYLKRLKSNGKVKSMKTFEFLMKFSPKLIYNYLFLIDKILQKRLNSKRR